MVSHPDFCYRHPQCRMQTPAYRKKYIDPLPDNPQLPVSIEEIDAMSAARVKQVCMVKPGFKLTRCMICGADTGCANKLVCDKCRKAQERETRMPRRRIGLGN